MMTELPSKYGNDRMQSSMMLYDSMILYDSIILYDSMPVSSCPFHMKLLGIGLCSQSIFGYFYHYE